MPQQLETLVSVNNIYEVPVWLLSAMSCSDGGQIRGREKGKALVEAEFANDAIRVLLMYPSYIDNYRKKSPEEQKRLKPFILRDGRITQVRPCDKRQKDNYGGYVCGKLQEDGVNGEFGGCFLSGFDAPEGLDCPYERA